MLEAAAKRFDEGLFPQQNSEAIKQAVPVPAVSPFEAQER